MKHTLSSMDVVILAGGKGSRLRSVTGKSPKALASINGVAFLDLLIGNLRSQGFKRVILCLGYKAREIIHHYKKNTFGIELVFIKEKTALGTGGAIKNARASIQSQTFFVLNGDCLCDVSFLDFLKFHRTKNALASMVLSKIKDKQDFGCVRTDIRGRIVCFKEKDDTDFKRFASAGIYCFEKEIFKSMPRKQAFSVEHEFFPRLVKKDFWGYVVNSEFMDIGTPERYQKAQEKCKHP